jgi:hypothetical protein
MQAVLRAGFRRVSGARDRRLKEAPVGVLRWGVARERVRASSRTERPRRAPPPLPGFAVSRPGDAAERAADRLARVALGSTAGARAAAPAPPPTPELLGAVGGPLREADRRELGDRFGHDFRNIRVHHDERAAAAAAAYRAAAFTVGQNIYFARGAYDPRSAGGRALLAHELAHAVVDGGRPLAVRRGGPCGGCAEVYEDVDEQRDERARAGAKAHKMIQRFYRSQLAHERRVPRSTKDQMDVVCPPSGTPEGAADLVKFGRLRADIGEIKSVNGAKYAALEVRHYLRRADQAVRRLHGDTSCGGKADRVDRRWDDHWFGGRVEAGRTPQLGVLDSVVPRHPGERIGKFSRSKTLYAKLDDGGAVLYWCNDSRRRREEEREARRAVAAQPEEKPAARPRRVRAELVGWHPSYDQAAHQLDLPEIEPGRQVFIAVPKVMFDPVEAQRQKEDLARRTRLLHPDVRAIPYLQFDPFLALGEAAQHPEFWMALAIGFLGGAAAVLLIAAVVEVAAAAAVGAVAVETGAVVAETGVVAAETGVAAGTTFTTSTGVTLTVLEGGAAAGTAATGATGAAIAGTAVFDKAAAAAAAALLVSMGTASEAQAEEATRKFIGRPASAVIDVTDRGGFGGYKKGQAIDINGVTYNLVIAIQSPSE